MKLDVPLFRQSKDSVECGLISLKMINSYYRKSSELLNLAKLIKQQGGVYSPQLALEALSHGYSIEIVTRNPLLVWKEHKNLTQQKIVAKLKEKLKNLTEEKDKVPVRYFIKFLEKGGILNIRIPSKEDIEEEIKQKRPLIVFLTTSTLYQKNLADTTNNKINYTFHTVVVTDIQNGKVFINDPFWGEEGGEKEYPIDEFLYAVYASALGDLDNACFMKIRKT